ncbi:unnamed protein product [Cladocopium goreaui]|uniref:Uncharacterized protein n=2 Tax=Cladocopium goreaui TaxID=2562237 RepID=A0A9P1FLY4_9DINO|nr:unnamed protein product [Cladocopium goreaui]
MVARCLPLPLCMCMWLQEAPLAYDFAMWWTVFWDAAATCMHGLHRHPGLQTLQYVVHAPMLWDCCNCRHLTRSLRHEVLLEMQHPWSLPEQAQVDADQPCWRTGFGDGILLSRIPTGALDAAKVKSYPVFVEPEIVQGAVSKLAVAGMQVLHEPLASSLDRCESLATYFLPAVVSTDLDMRRKVAAEC